MTQREAGTGDSDIKPAMRPFEWADEETLMPVVDNTNGVLRISDFPDNVEEGQCITVPDFYRHAVAAFALHGMTFGFTHEDVRHLRIYARMLDGQRNGSLGSIADRIEALLPPHADHPDSSPAAKAAVDAPSLVVSVLSGNTP